MSHYDLLTKEQLIILLKQEERRHINQHARVQNLEKQIKIERSNFAEAIRKISGQEFHYYSAENDVLFEHLMKLVEAIREVLGVENIKYGLGWIAAGQEPNAERILHSHIIRSETLQRLALELQWFYQYFDWDDE